jgi:hypothetical protein
MEAALSGAVAALISTGGLVYARMAARNSKPVGNGAVPSMLRSLERIEDRLDKHMENHR